MAVSAASVIGTRIRGHVKNPAPIGPDTGSRQWVFAVATHANAPFLIVDTVRSGDQRVAVSVPDAVWLKQCTPVIVDAIASTARALAAVNRAIAATSNTMAHDGNAITLDAELTNATAQALRLMAPH